MPPLYNRESHSIEKDNLVYIKSNEAHFSHRITINNEVYPPNIIHASVEDLDLGIDFVDNKQIKIRKIFYIP